MASIIYARAEEVVHTLHDYLTGLVEECAALHGALVRTFFSHLAWRPWEAEAAEPGSGSPAPGAWQALCSAQ